MKITKEEARLITAMRKNAESPEQTIRYADTPSKCWNLFESLVNDPNGYGDAVVLQNARDWVQIAQRIF